MVGEGLTGRDTQLDTAVRELLKQLGERAPAPRAAGGQNR
jgi:hypothetical protein